MSFFTQLQKASIAHNKNHPSSAQNSSFYYFEMVSNKTSFYCCLLIRQQVIGESLAWCYCSLWF